MRVLTINNGSSSLKAAMYDMHGSAAPNEKRVLTGDAARVGIPGGHLRIRDDCDQAVLDEPRDLPGSGAALEALFDWLEEHGRCGHPEAIGHRIVHGGTRYSEHHPTP